MGVQVGHQAGRELGRYVNNCCENICPCRRHHSFVLFSSRSSRCCDSCYGLVRGCFLDVWPWYGLKGACFILLFLKQDQIVLYTVYDIKCHNMIECKCNIIQHNIIQCNVA